jgi:hypothetical protein
MRVTRLGKMGLAGILTAGLVLAAYAQQQPQPIAATGYLVHIVAIRNATDATESPNMKAAEPIPLTSPTRRWETMAPMK